jgi:predicted O-methyltransferase YrrM
MAIVKSSEDVMVDECHASLIAALVKAHKPVKLLELGVGSGFTSKQILDSLDWNGLDTARYTLVDNWADWNFSIPEGIEHIARHPMCTIYQLSEMQFVFSTPEKYDFIFSDADHWNADKWFDYVYERLLEPGGILIYHDVCTCDPPDGGLVFPNLKNIYDRCVQLGIYHKVFNKSSKPDERCWRGLLVIFKKEATV